MTRAAKTCSHPTCPNLQPCPDHAPKPWTGSHRRERTTSGWEQQRRARRLLQADDTCHICGQLGADQVDHVIPLAEGGRDDLSNLAPIHKDPCHRRKTEAEAQRARRTRGATPNPK
jgi:5-methylcytosine-specific restriction protein A